MLAKDGSGGEQGCDTLYLVDDHLAYVQAAEASAEVYAEAKNLLPGERIVGVLGVV
jgi:hypothetical protein